MSSPKHRKECEEKERSRKSYRGEPERIVGYYQSRKNFGFVVPDNERFLQDIFVPAERSKGAVTGHKVVVELTSYGEEWKEAGRKDRRDPWGM